MTMRGGPTDTNLEAKVLGLKDQSDEVAQGANPNASPNTGSAKAGGKSNLRRKETLSKTGKLEQQ